VTPPLALGRHNPTGSLGRRSHEPKRESLRLAAQESFRHHEIAIAAVGEDEEVARYMQRTRTLWMYETARHRRPLE
jgi:hypothetical protein